MVSPPLRLEYVYRVSVRVAHRCVIHARTSRRGARASATGVVPAVDARALFEVRIVSPGRAPFTCGNRIPVNPDCSVADDPGASIVILPEIWLGPDESMHGRHAELAAWIRRTYRKGATLYSACSDSVMLAETGLLDGYQATSHWGYEDLFRNSYPKVRFDPARNLVYADTAARIVTASGTISWHDLALHIRRMFQPLAAA